ncbi:DMT family transporter [Leptolyngbyaceae cyanobacterium CCMR0082]|uniref:DMT family transporter n=2 Tax=Adonisia turfae TaxID=2950184 RepID=A0A6M0RZM6_9CYAN|nr:DMT family transporter [Adonisia turfae]MDV3352221.1 DMT family transporter [Leptothoe sp. LEGE 181152]NEZ57105.1 DMT family transporter [Adonisia turfae CCMR0081]NEZ61645.1 DMT family transporter [Adonisia turfae CCMR0082]
MFQGEIAALSAAGLWAFATLMFGRLGKQLSPLVLNLIKGSMAIGFIVLTLAVRQQLLASLPMGSVVLLLISGVVGIGLGDTAYFATVNTLGARQALLLEMLAPPMAALMSLVFLQEQLSALACLGMGLTLAGIIWVVSERSPQVQSTRSKAAITRGILLGIMAALGQSIGSVLSRAALADTAVDPLWSSLLRLSAGLVCIGGLLLWRRQEQVFMRPSGRLLGGVAIAAFFGTYLAIWLQQVALKYSPAGIAQSLLATSPIMVIPMALVIGERVTVRAVCGAIVALVGVWLLFSR